VYRTEELRNFLVAEGHAVDEAVAAIRRGQDAVSTEHRRHLGAFTLTAVGRRCTDRA
jgi:hypothetical protein